jgi:hypothetical protein
VPGIVRDLFRIVSYHYAVHANESLTPATAGNTPAMVHQHSKGLATKAEAERWFDVEPESPATVVTLPATA